VKTGYPRRPGRDGRNERYGFKQPGVPLKDVLYLSGISTRNIETGALGPAAVAGAGKQHCPVGPLLQRPNDDRFQGRCPGRQAAASPQPGQKRRTIPADMLLL